MGRWYRWEEEVFMGRGGIDGKRVLLGRTYRWEEGIDRRKVLMGRGCIHGKGYRWEEEVLWEEEV